MRVSVSLLFLFFALLLFSVGLFLPSALAFALVVYLLLGSHLKGFVSGLSSELEGAVGQVPDSEVWAEGLRVGGARVGEQLFSDNESVTRLKSLRVMRFRFRPEGVGGASKRVIDFFKRLFE